MPDTEWKMKRYHQKWLAGETPSCGIGQGAVAVTPLQMAVAIGGIAEDGQIHRPYLVDSIIDTNGKTSKHTKPEVRRRVQATPEQFGMVRNAMRLAVTSGTGKVMQSAGHHGLREDRLGGESEARRMGGSCASRRWITRR